MGKKYLKYALFVVGGLLVIVVAVVLIVLATFDPNTYKPRIVQMVKEKTGRTLAIQGNIGLAFFPKIGADVPRTTLSEQTSANEFAGVDRLRIHVALLPLLRKRVVVDEVRLEGLRANLVKFKDGTTNFSDLIPKGGKKPLPETGEPSPPGVPYAFDVGGVRILKSHLGWKDETMGRDLAVDVIELKTGRLADKQAAPVTLEASIKGVQPKIDLNVKANGTLTFDLAEPAYSLSGFSTNVTGSAMDISGLAVTLAGDIVARGAKPSIQMSKLNLEAKGSRGKDLFHVKVSAPTVEGSADAVKIQALSAVASGTFGNLKLSTADLKAANLILNPPDGQVLVDGLALQAKGKMGADDLDVTLSAPKLEASPERASGQPAELLVNLRGADRKAAVALKLSGMEGSAKALKISALQLNVDASQKGSAVKGTLTTPITGNVQAKIFELPKIAGDFTVSGPQIPQKTMKLSLSGSARADFGKEDISANLQTKVDQSTIKAKVGMVRFQAPAYKFDVDIDQINLDRYLPPEKEKAEGGEPPPGKPGEQPIDFSPLKPLDLDGKLRVGALQARNIKTSNLRVDLRAKNGILNADPVSANLYQGTAKGNLSVDANANRIAVKQDLTGVAIGPLLHDAANKDILEGKGNVALNVTATGNRVSAMKKGLNGTARMALRDGAIKGVDIPGTVRRVRAELGGKDAEGVASKAQKTDFSELTASFAIKNGVAHNDDLSLKSPLLRATGAGDINIGEDSLDYVVNVILVGTMAGQGGKALGELKGLTIPVRLSGPYTALKYKVEFSQMFSGKEQIEAGKELLKKTGKEQLETLGKGLLGGKENAPQGEKKPPASSRKPEDEIKDKLKGLLR